MDPLIDQSYFSNVKKTQNQNQNYTAKQILHP